LGWQREVKSFEQDFVIGFWMGVAAYNQGASVGRWKVCIEHLDGAGGLTRGRQKKGSGTTS
jgi:hypothetical protein